MLSEPSAPPAQGSHSTAGQGARLSPPPQCHRQLLFFEVPTCVSGLCWAPRPLSGSSVIGTSCGSNLLCQMHPGMPGIGTPEASTWGLALNLHLSRTLSGENWSGAKWGDGAQGTPAHQMVAPEDLLVWGTRCWIRLSLELKSSCNLLSCLDSQAAICGPVTDFLNARRHFRMWLCRS